MDSTLEELEPKLLWKHFNELRKIYRCSKNEEECAEYVISVAKNLGLYHYKDKSGNVVVKKPATSGKEEILPVILQSHLDMVCVNINKDNPEIKIEIKIEDNGEKYLNAIGTTLGADDGMGICASLAILEDKTAIHPPLELLFTVNEEDGMTGAKGLNENELAGRKMINLDSEHEVEICVGSAGGKVTHLYLPVRWEESCNVALKVILKGLKGGHSGVDIHLERGNAIKLLSRMLLETNEKISFQLASLKCTNDKSNRIPDDAEAVIILPINDVNLFESWIKMGERTLKEEYKYVEDKLEVLVEEQDLPDKVIAQVDSKKVLDIIMALPNGIIRWTPENPEHKMSKLVQTSVNLASVNITEDNRIYILLFFRSLEKTEIKALVGRVKSIARMVGAGLSEGESFPEWSIYWNSEMLKICDKVYKEFYGKDKYKVTATHGGLEVGVIRKTFPNMDTISIGPEINNPHTINERVKILSVERFYKVLKKLLEQLENSP